jgi:hypothetical protein
MGLPKDALVERAEYVSAAPATLFKASEGDLLRLFDFHFKAIDATSSEMIAIAHQIRYQVYCVEHAFEREADHADGLVGAAQAEEILERKFRALPGELRVNVGDGFNEPVVRRGIGLVDCWMSGLTGKPPRLGAFLDC